MVWLTPRFAKGYAHQPGQEARVYIHSLIPPLLPCPPPLYRLDNTALAAANVCSISSSVCAKEVNPASN